MGISIITSGGGGGGDLASFRSDHRVAYYDCSDDGTSGLQDSEGTNHLSEYVASTATFGNTGVNGDCIGLTGNSDFFSVQSSDICPDATEDLTISFWIKTTGTVTSRQLVTVAADVWGNADPKFRTIIQDTVSLKTALNSTFGIVHTGSGITINDGNWHHLLYILQRTTEGSPLCTNYLDGKLVGTQNTNTQYDYSSGYFHVGRVLGTYMDGLIDEIEVFKGVGAVPSPSVIAEMAAEY